MAFLHPHCAGLDVHKKTITACLRLVDENDNVHKEIRQFDIMTPDLLLLSEWLFSQDVTHVAMESSGVYWKPIYNLLEDDFQLLLVNAAHAKNVPGIKTDVQDADLIADLLAHGLLHASYVPDCGRRDLRELVRYRKSLIQQRSAEINRIHKVLEEINIKLANVVSQITGKTVRVLLDAIVAGETDPQSLTKLARGTLRNKREELACFQ
jgi:transposase